MRTFPIIEESTNQQVGFEIENAYVLPGTIATLLKSLDGVSDVQLAGTFLAQSDERVGFKYFEESYTVLEPFGDNSRYLIASNLPSKSSENIVALENLFKEYDPPLWRKLIGDFLTFRPLGWMREKWQEKTDSSSK